MQLSVDEISNSLILKKHGIDKYLDEQDVITILKRADFGIRVDFLENYPEIIPENIAARKKEVDALKFFDNYAVMHYDPKGSALKIMKAEEARRDPILFGMVSNSTRLYVIADWVIGDDDITLEKISKYIGRDVQQIINAGASKGSIGHLASMVLEEDQSTDPTIA